MQILVQLHTPAMQLGAYDDGVNSGVHAFLQCLSNSSTCFGASPAVTCASRGVHFIQHPLPSTASVLPVSCGDGRRNHTSLFTSRMRVHTLNLWPSIFLGTHHPPASLFPLCTGSSDRQFCFVVLTVVSAVPSCTPPPSPCVQAFLSLRLRAGPTARSATLTLAPTEACLQPRLLQALNEASAAVHQCLSPVPNLTRAVRPAKRPVGPALFVSEALGIVPLEQRLLLGFACHEVGVEHTARLEWPVLRLVTRGEEGGDGRWGQLLAEVRLCVAEWTSKGGVDGGSRWESRGGVFYPSLPLSTRHTGALVWIIMVEVGCPSKKFSICLIGHTCGAEFSLKLPIVPLPVLPIRGRAADHPISCCCAYPTQ